MAARLTFEVEARIREIIREELSSFLKSDRFVLETTLQMLDGRGMQFGRSNGTKIATATDQKLSFYGKTPVVQQARPTDAASIITTGTTLGLWA